MGNIIDASRENQRQMIANTQGNNLSGTQVGVKALTDGTLVVSTATNTGIAVPFSFQQTANQTAAALNAVEVRDSVTILNDPSGTAGNNDVYVGGAGVTLASGFKLQPGASINLKVPITDTIFVIANGGQTALLFVVGS